MIRNFERLKDGPFDLLVIGGGVYGAWTAMDASLRGLRTALVDRGDWACATSSASTKLIHGGLRYLEQLRLDLVHASLLERRRLAGLAPHRVTPLIFGIPMHEQDRVGVLKFKTGLWLYDKMAGEGQPVPPHERLSREKTAERWPFLDARRLRGSFLYGDCQTDDARMVLDVVDGACRAGAVTVNYAEAVSLMFEKGRAAGAVVEDRAGKGAAEVRARVVVCAAGPWVSNLAASHAVESGVRFSRGTHLVLPALPTDDALLLLSRRDSRIFFIVPWYGKSLVGTTDSPFAGSPDEVAPTAEEIDYLLEEANLHLAGAGWRRESVIGAFAGLRTLKNEPGSSLSQTTREWSVLEPKPGLLVSVGGKYTTARLDAGRLVDRVLAALGLPSAGSAPTVSALLPSTPKSEFRQWRKEILARARSGGLSSCCAESLIFRFGIGAERILAGVENAPEAGRKLAEDLPFLRGEIEYSAKNEMVVHLNDLLRRRMPLVLLRRPDRLLAEAVARTVAPSLNWSKRRQADEVRRLMDRWTAPWLGAADQAPAAEPG